MWCGEHIRDLLYIRFVWFSGLSPCWSMLRKCRLACFGRVQEKEESVPACMLWSGAEKRGDRAGAHVRERWGERESARERMGVVEH